MQKQNKTERQSQQNISPQKVEKKKKNNPGLVKFVD